MDWRLKVARQAVLARIPFGYGLRRIKRKVFGYQPNLGNLRETLACWRQMRDGLERAGGSVEGATVLEIGTGWFPTIPVMQCLAGAKHVYMSDLNVHLDDVSFAATLDFLRRELPDEPRLREIQSRRDVPVSYLAPFDVNAIPDGSIDIVSSRTVLEHIPLRPSSSCSRPCGPSCRLAASWSIWWTIPITSNIRTSRSARSTS